ncbi:MAG: ribosomal L7Ae/L30e/S12e/Gadd45 family protein [Bacillota bacterium]|nr:ribosomal L7Ae/L30e/S12e/Gadd45 family protein [Bacillota bacterium]
MVDRLTGKKVVGIKQTMKAINNDEVEVVYVAEDADPKLVEKIKMSSIDKSLEIKYITTMKELGKLCNIDVGAAAVAILK